MYQPLLLDSYGTMVVRKTSGKPSRSEENPTSLSIGRHQISREIL
jgi:hypothetical protein